MYILSMAEESLAPVEELLLTLYEEFTLRNGRAGKSGSSSLTSLIGGAWPLRRYSLNTKPDNRI